MSRRQLHEAEAGNSLESTFPVRACGMEAEDVPQLRAQAKPRKAGLSGLTCSSTRRPIIQPWQDGIEDGSDGKPFILTQGGLSEPTKVEGWKEATTTTRCSERSRISS